MTTKPPLGSIWERDGDRFIVASHQGDGVQLRPIVKGMVKGRRFAAPVVDGHPGGYTHLPEHQSPTLRCVDRAAAQAAVRFLRTDGVSDAFAAGPVVVAPNGTPIVAWKLHAAAKGNGWLPEGGAA